MNEINKLYWDINFITLMLVICFSVVTPKRKKGNTYKKEKKEILIRKLQKLIIGKIGLLLTISNLSC